MALFQKKVEHNSSLPLYTTSLSKTLLIVGLGNPGEEYKNTRHNIGFEIIDVLVNKTNMDNWVHKKDLLCQLSTGNFNGIRVIAIKPQTYMNKSGEAVSRVMKFYKIPASSLVVVHDELTLQFGQIRTRLGGSSAGHNGIKSIINHCPEDFGRIKVGIANEFSDSVDSSKFVLGKFTDQENSQIANLTQETTALITEYIYSGELAAETRSFII